MRSGNTRTKASVRHAGMHARSNSAAARRIDEILNGIEPGLTDSLHAHTWSSQIDKKTGRRVQHCGCGARRPYQPPEQ